MILPTKGVSPSKSLITLGAEVIGLLNGGSLSMSGLWYQLQDARDETERLSYDWFLLSLDLLFIMGAVDIDDNGLIGMAVQ